MKLNRQKAPAVIKFRGIMSPVAGGPGIGATLHTRRQNLICSTTRPLVKYGHL